MAKAELEIILQCGSSVCSARSRSQPHKPSIRIAAVLLHPYMYSLTRVSIERETPIYNLPYAADIKVLICR